jgi:hypothetical protein
MIPNSARYISQHFTTLTFNFYKQVQVQPLLQVQFTLSKGAYVAGAIERNADYVEVAIDLEGIGNTTRCQVQLLDTLQSGHITRMLSQAETFR